MFSSTTGRIKILAFLVVYVCLKPSIAFAEQLQSQNYLIDESAVGTSDMTNSSSSSYQATNATGALSVGSASSANYNIDAGTKTTPDPTLTFRIEDATANFGTFSASMSTTTTTSFSVINYTSYGYVAQIIGSSLSNGTHTIDAMSTTGPSIVGKDQFGINLVNNTLPFAFGANLINDIFGAGVVSANYSTPNQFRYISGESIAQAPKSSGKTTYTISYLVNVAGLTPGGQYTSDQTIIVTGTY